VALQTVNNSCSFLSVSKICSASLYSLSVGVHRNEIECFTSISWSCFSILAREILYNVLFSHHYILHQNLQVPLGLWKLPLHTKCVPYKLIEKYNIMTYAVETLPQLVVWLKNLPIQNLPLAGFYISISLKSDNKLDQFWTYLLQMQNSHRNLTLLKPTFEW